MVDLVLLNFNDSTTVKEFIHHIINYKLIDHIIIVDNASTDDSYAKLKQLCSKKVVLIQTNENGGYAKGNNYGIKYAIEHFNSKHIIISNPDVLFEEKIIPILKNKLEKTNVAGVTGKMICTSSIKLPVAWKLPNYIDCLFENLLILKKILGKNTEYNIENIGTNDIYVEALPGSFFMIDTDKMEKVGFFDENTFLYYEENILGFKFKEKGYKQLLALECSYVHNHSISVNKSIKSEAKRLKLAYESRKYYCKQYLNTNAIQQFILFFSFYVGRINFLIAKRIKKIAEYFYIIKEIL